MTRTPGSEAEELIRAKPAALSKRTGLPELLSKTVGSLPSKTVTVCTASAGVAAAVAVAPLPLAGLPRQPALAPSDDERSDDSMKPASTTRTRPSPAIAPIRMRIRVGSLRLRRRSAKSAVRGRLPVVSDATSLSS